MGGLQSEMMEPRMHPSEAARVEDHLRREPLANLDHAREDLHTTPFYYSLTTAKLHATPFSYSTPMKLHPHPSTIPHRLSP